MLFKLKSPANTIVGGGFFEHYTELPLSLAWEAFGIKNGAPSQQATWERIARLRHIRPEWYEDFTIGCIILVEPFFWSEELWIPEPPDWSPNIVRGKTYDLHDEPGRTLWAQVTDRLLEIRTRQPGISPTEIPGGYSEPVPVRRRLGQGTFRILVTDAYQRQCAVTRERALPALEASHIRPFAELETHSVRNGLLLRSDLHRLFDAGYLTVTPDYCLKASPRMREDFDDGETYVQLSGPRIWVPTREEDRPDPAFLLWHNENRFRG